MAAKRHQRPVPVSSGLLLVLLAAGFVNVRSHHELTIPLFGIGAVLLYKYLQRKHKSTSGSQKSDSQDRQVFRTAFDDGYGDITHYDIKRQPMLDARLYNPGLRQIDAERWTQQTQSQERQLAQLKWWQKSAQVLGPILVILLLYVNYR